MVLDATAIWLGILCVANKLLLLAERRNALSTLDYALASGADGAASTRIEVDAAMKRTAEEVSLQKLPPCFMSCVLKLKAAFCFQGSAHPSMGLNFVITVP